MGGSESERERARKRKERTRQPSSAGVLPVACVVCVFQDSGSEARQERAQILPEHYKSTGWLQQADTMQLHNKNNLFKKSVKMVKNYAIHSMADGDIKNGTD